MAKNGAFIGFPEGRLREKPVRLPVLVNERDWFAVNKFAGLLPQAHPWYADRPNLVQAIREQAESGKGELRRLGIASCFFICGPECESAGPALFAKTKPGADLLKNAYGSDQIEFRYRFLTPARHPAVELNCDLPVGPHQSEQRSVITHRFGKKSITRFKKMGESPSLDLWEAFTFRPRLHQIRLHAAELGIPILGDTVYRRKMDDQTAGSNRIESRSFKSHFSRLASVLVTMDLSRALDDGPLLELPPPKPFSALLRKCGLTGVE